MKILRVAVAWLALCGAAYAQSQVPAGGVMGNSTAGQRPARAETVTSILDRALGSTRGAILERGAASWQIVVPNATAGLPFVSAGTGADPLYQLLGVVGGGTGQNTYAIGDILQASASTTLARLAAVATGNALISGGVGTVSSWGKIASTHLNITTTSCTNQFVSAISAGAVGTCASVPIGTAVSGLGTTVATTLAAAVNATGGIVSPTPTRAGDIIYWNGSNWVTLAGNNSGTNILQENASGVPSWVANAGFTAATKADQQAATSNVVAITPLHQQDHDSAAKVWVNFTGSTGAILTSYNVGSMSRTGVGEYTINFTTAFATANYMCQVTSETGGTAPLAFVYTGVAKTTALVHIGFENAAGGAFVDPTIGHVVCFGRQ